MTISKGKEKIGGAVEIWGEARHQDNEESTGLLGDLVKKEGQTTQGGRW